MREVFRYAWPYLRRYRSGLALGFGALIAKDVVAAAMPLVIREGIDAIVGDFQLKRLWQFAAVLVALSVVKGIFQYWMRVILVGISRDVEYDLRNDLFAQLTRLSQDFYARFRTGDIMARATNDLNHVRMMLGPGVMYWCETVFLFICAVAIMLIVDWRLTLLALLPAPVVSFVVVYFGRRIHERFEVIQTMFGDISSRVQENLSSVRLLRAFRQHDSEVKKFSRMNEEYVQANLDLAWKTGLFMPSLQALIGLTFLIVLWAGGMRLLDGSLTIGSFVMFQMYMNMLIWPMIAFGWVINLTQRGKASFERIQAVLSEAPGIHAPAHPVAVPQPLRGEIEIEGVHLSFGSTEVLRGIDLSIPAGSTVAIVGHTGSGKTTLVSLIPRLHDPTAGRVRIDGTDIREYGPAELRRQISFVPQETFLFSTTIADNIAFGVEDATREQIAEAARLAGLDRDIAEFPQGYDTLLGERGITLSGGQRQRCAIARAVLRDPAILVLDDALSSVDTLTEERILTSLAGIMGGRTTILISHRVSTVRHADRIFVIEEGRVAEQGTHAELITLGGYYADLHRKQLLEEELESA
jgi:ATP-binding cassette subfamily B protein